MLSQLYKLEDDWQYDRSEGDWFKVLEPTITALIQKTLDHKYQLSATGRDYEYTWPNNGDKYDSGEMKVLGPDPRGRQGVRFTMFPGLKVTLMNKENPPLENVSNALVRTQLWPNRLG